MKELTQEKQLKEESENDEHTEEVDETTELVPQLPNPEFFSFNDGKGRTLTLGSRLFNAAQLCGMGAEFLGLPVPSHTPKEIPEYLK